MLTIASSIGTSCTFFISRFLFQKQVEALLGGKFMPLREKLSRNGFYMVFFLRVIPLVPYEALNYLGGISKIKFKDYFLATFLGLLPGIFIAIYFSDSLAKVHNLKEFISIKFLILSLLFAAVLLLPALYKLFVKKEI
ncbi:MAG: VTT domain-containing protein [Candidatus Omnitrophica bacterium]|nr:VTT domain-containing protein [Candidatus Omnitrophota bacterium]